MSKACRGRIVWVEITDPQGQNPKCRPAVILTATENIHANGDVWVVGVSTQIDAAPADVCVELPWDRKRHPRTGLKERCAAVCTWLKKVGLADIKEYAGTVPGKQMLEILRKVGNLPGESPASNP
jgi:mRNA-degrading endonuclease toxin of MazEF toxin-antitoxin module